MKYINVGSGSKGNSTLVYDDDTTILIDCGVSKKRVLDCLHTISRDLSFIDAIFLTHSHSDHAAHLDSYDALAERIYSGDEGLIEKKYRETNTLKEFQQIKIKSFIVQALPTSHDAPDSMGYLIKENKRKETLLYMTDTGYIPEKDLDYMKDCTYYLIESNHDPRMLMQSNRTNYLKMRILGSQGHLSNEQCSHYLSLIVGKNTREIAFAHLSEECNTPSKVLSCFNDMMRIQTGSIPKIKIQTMKQKDPTFGGDID